jgi:hypothetical protein
MSTIINHLPPRRWVSADELAASAGLTRDSCLAMAKAQWRKGRVRMSVRWGKRWGKAWFGLHYAKLAPARRCACVERIRAGGAIPHVRGSAASRSGGMDHVSEWANEKFARR